MADLMDERELVFLERKHRNCVMACPHRWEAFGKEPHCAHSPQPWEDGVSTVRRLVAALREARATPPA
jgi:hypothetical protein